MAQYWNPDMEKLDRKSIGDLQGRKLRSMVRDRLSRHHPFYSRLLKGHGIDPREIEGVDDLKRLPFTTHEDLASDPESFILAPGEKTLAGQRSIASRFQYLFYDAVVGNSRIRQLDEFYPVTTFETSSRIPIYLSKYDLEIFKELCGRAALCAGLTQMDRYQNTYLYGENVDFWHSHYMAMMMRVFAVKTGQAGPRGELEAAKRLSPTVIAGDPYYLAFVAKAAIKANIDLGKLRLVLLSGSTLDDGLRKKLSGMLERCGATPDLVDSYAVPECKQSLPCCPGGRGYHTYPDVHIWECVDVKTGEPVSEGERGELAFTGIDGRGTTLLRFRTGDIAEGGIVHGECETCGRTVPRIIGPIIKRNGDKAGRIMGRFLDCDSVVYASASTEQGGSRLSIRVRPEDESQLSDILAICEKYDVSPVILR
jgi:phenylacetate-CoA ligase